MSKKWSRNQDIVAQRQCGLTYQRIAENYQLTPTRVRQICMLDALKVQTKGRITDPDRIEQEWQKIEAHR